MKGYVKVSASRRSIELDKSTAEGRILQRNGQYGILEMYN